MVRGYKVTVNIPQPSKNNDDDDLTSHLSACALPFKAALINTNSVMNMASKHGDYSWVSDFLMLDYANANLTTERVQQMHPHIATVEHVKEVCNVQLLPCLKEQSLQVIRTYRCHNTETQFGQTYLERTQALRTQCNVIIHVDWEVRSVECKRNQSVH